MFFFTQYHKRHKVCNALSMCENSIMLPEFKGEEVFDHNFSSDFNSKQSMCCKQILIPFTHWPYRTNEFRIINICIQFSTGIYGYFLTLFCRDITGYLLSFRVIGLRSLADMFSVIRGKSLINHYSFMLYEMMHWDKVRKECRSF